MCYIQRNDQSTKPELPAILKEAMEKYPEGIYFGMPEDEYHEIPFLSRSAMEDLFVGEQEYWENSAFNQVRERSAETPAMKLGSAIHCLMLEPELFESLYVTTPTPQDFEGRIILDKNSQISDFLVSVGEKKSGSKAELIARAQPYLDPTTHVIWDNVMQSFHERVEENGLRILSPNEVELLTGIRDSLNRRESIREILSNGMPEVTIIWQDEESGAMMKCRLDYVRPEAIGEVKSFSLKRKQNIYKAMCKEIQYEWYNLQYVIYHSAVKTIIKKLRAKKAKVFGEVDPEWLAKFLSIEDKQFFFIFVRTQAPYQCKAIEMQERFSKGADTNMYYSEAWFSFQLLAQMYVSSLEEFGEDPWYDKQDIGLLEDEHVPGIMYQGHNA